jgi:ABC-2 type transport system permease protein
MSQVLTLARKELRAYFRSPVALIFLGTFLCVTLFTFFWVDTFFRRNLADIRPLFHWLPVLLVFLVGALTMRLWSEEQRAGTLEVLLTLPVQIHRLVLGKYLAGLALCGIALALTLGIPITVSMLGDLDWGPVVGGYLAALLLASAYLAIGLCLSSATDNPIVALLTSWAACGVLFLVGSDELASFAGTRWAETLRALGSGSRFESIQRGVIDLRDLAYYGSITVFFLWLNTAILAAKRWSRGPRTRSRRSATRLAVALVFANLLAFNLVIAGVRGVRLDLTERSEYSISKATRSILAGLDAPLLIRGYFSQKTHPLLAPLVPRIRDLAQEYAAVGGNKVRVEIVDPRSEAALEKEANEDYGIKSVPFQFEDRHEAAVVNSYFSVLIKYGDKHEILGFQDLIEVKVTGMKEIEVRLRNLEYDLTRTIKKVVYGFQPLESVFARAPGKVTLTAYLTPKALPKSFREIPARLEKVAKEIAGRAGGRFVFEKVDPSGEEKGALRRELYEKHGIKPLAVSMFSEESFYLHLLLSVGEKRERIYPAPEMGEAELRAEVTAALKRMVPGFLKTIGLVSPPPEGPPPNPMMRRRPQQNQLQLLREKLGETYSVRDAELKDGRVPGDVDVLLLCGVQDLDEKQRFAVDQYLMRGGAVIVLSGGFAMDTGAAGGISVKQVKSGLDELLARWGVKIQPLLVLDPQNEAFPVPVERNVMGMQVRELQLLPYPFFVDVRPDGMAEGSPVVAGLPSVTIQWASPLELSPGKEVTATTLLRSSKGSWTQSSTSVQPNFEKHGERGFAPEGEQKARPLAVTMVGIFRSAFADKPSPLFNEAPASQPASKKGDPAGRTVKSSPPTARLAVVGSSELVNDLVLSLSRQTGSERFVSNLQLVQNLSDWAVADVDLLSIRSRGTFSRTLKPIEESSRSSWELGNYVLALLALGVIVGTSAVRRRGVRPMALSAAPEEKDREKEQKEEKAP